MPKGQPHPWTREELEEVVACSGREAHVALANRLGLTPNSIYSTRGKVRGLGGIDNFLERQHLAGASLKPRVAETIVDQLDRVYLINQSGAGREGFPQYTVTVPSRIAEQFVDVHGRQVRFEPREEGILIVPVPRAVAPDLPSWLSDSPRASLRSLEGALTDPSPAVESGDVA